MRALLDVCCQLMEKQLLEDCSMALILADVICACLRQACERIERIRGAAARTIMKILEFQVHHHIYLLPDISRKTCHDHRISCRLDSSQERRCTHQQEFKGCCSMFKAKVVLAAYTAYPM